MELPSGICPDCNHPNDKQESQYIEACNNQLLCTNSGVHHRTTLCDRRCTCPCKCSVEDGDEDDTEYEDSMEPEDDTQNSFKDRAVAAEQPMARTYGWRTNVTSNYEDGSERRIFFEAPGHHAVGHMHDTGIPQESSLTNSENTVGQTEVGKLREILEPWELEAVHLSTGLPYSYLSESFPEARHMQLPADWHSQRDQGLNLTCRNCQKPYSEEFLEWTREGNARVCENCGITRRPDDENDDPDYQVLRIDFRRAMDECSCRCDCLPDLSPPTTAHGSMSHDISQSLDSPVEQAHLHQPHLPFQIAQRSSFSDWLHVDLRINTARPRWEEDEDTALTSPTSSGVSPETAEHRRQTRRRYSLPELRFSDNADSREARLEEMRMAIEDGEAVEAFEDYEGAYNYAGAAISFGRDILAADDPALQEAQSYMLRMAERRFHQTEE